MTSNTLKKVEQVVTRYDEMIQYLSSDNCYWIKDVWHIRDGVFQSNGHKIPKQKMKGLCFEKYKNIKLRNELKYFLAYSLKTHSLSACTVFRNYRFPLEFMGEYMSRTGMPASFSEMQIDMGQIEMILQNKGITTGGAKGDCYRFYRHFIRGLVDFITEAYDERPMLEKDLWYAAKINGIRISAIAKNDKKSINFKDIPIGYREMIKRYFRTLITRRSWSFCLELLMYLRYFFRVFYEHGYQDGFLKELNREAMEHYYVWAMEDYAGKNATYRSKSVSYIHQFIGYIQLAQHPQAPIIDVERFIFKEDYPKRERMRDTYEKVKYIPEPVKVQLDALIYELDDPALIPIYILLRETGWRGTDIFNLRYNNCLEYKWNSLEKRYVNYLCGEITKTGIPSHRIPIRSEVADMVKKLSAEAKINSDENNNPYGYLFNTYEGRDVGLPMKKLTFVNSVKKLIDQKNIIDGDGNIYHFKTHALRHTRAMEYAESGMPIGIIQQILGHCSLQMTLHYAKVSENTLYEKWKETEKLNLFQLNGVRKPKESNIKKNEEENLHYQYVRQNLDAVKVPFGTCFKPSKLSCRNQMNQCLECGSFCSTKNNIPEFEEEIKRVEKLIEISKANGRNDWEEKNQAYLKTLESMMKRVKEEGIIHKNGSIREVPPWQEV